MLTGPVDCCSQLYRPVQYPAVLTLQIIPRLLRLFGILEVVRSNSGHISIQILLVYGQRLQSDSPVTIAVRRTNGITNVFEMN